MATPVSPSGPILVPFDLLHEVSASAGGVLWRREHGRVQLAMVHRAGKDDWGFPKGRLRQGESGVDGAVREIAEETGYSVSRPQLLGSLVRHTRKGRTKIVSYWLMEPGDGTFQPTAEIDALVWVDLAVAERALGRSHEAALFEELRLRLDQALAPTA